MTIRTRITDIREAGRATQGVTLIRLDEGDEIAATSKIEEQEEAGPEGEGEQTDASVPSTDSPSDETASNPTPEVS